MEPGGSCPLRCARLAVGPMGRSPGRAGFSASDEQHLHWQEAPSAHRSSAVGPRSLHCPVPTVPEGAGRQPRPCRAYSGKVGTCSPGCRPPGHQQAPYAPGAVPGWVPSQDTLGAVRVWAGRPPKAPWSAAGGYLAEQLVGQRGLYLKVAGRLKIEAFRLGRERCCPFPRQRLAPAHAGHRAAGQAGAGGARPHPTLGPGCSSAAPPPHPHGLPGRHWPWSMASAVNRRPATGCPLGPSLRAWLAG